MLRSFKENQKEYAGRIKIWQIGSDLSLQTRFHPLLSCQPNASFMSVQPGQYWKL